MNRNHPIKKLVKKARSAAVLAKELEFVTKERDKLQRDFDSYKAIADSLVDDARKGIGLSGVTQASEMKNLVRRTWSAPQLLKELKTAQSDVDSYHTLSVRLGSQLEKTENQLENLEKAHAELQKFYTQSQDELHACRERELMHPWWKKLLRLR